MIKDNKIVTNYEFWDSAAFKAGRDNVNNKLKVFDWDKFTDYILSLGEIPENVIIGLNGDFDNTNGYAIKNGKICKERDPSMWLSSTHCVPCFTFDNESCEECWLWEDETEYNRRTFWPEHCVAKLQGK